MRFEEGWNWLEALLPYISLAEFPRLHEYVRTEHFETIVGPETLKELDFLTLGVIRHAGRTGDELTAANALREHFYLGYVYSHTHWMVR